MVISALLFLIRHNSWNNISGLHSDRGKCHSLTPWTASTTHDDLCNSRMVPPIPYDNLNVVNQTPIREMVVLFFFYVKAFQLALKSVHHEFLTWLFDGYVPSEVFIDLIGRMFSTVSRFLTFALLVPPTV